MKKEYLKPDFDVIAFRVREALMSGTGVGGGTDFSGEGVEDGEGWED